MGCIQAILALNHPITDQGNKTSYPNMLSANKLSQHAFGQSKARETRHAIPACSSLDKLFQHAVNQLKAREARHYPSMQWQPITTWESQTHYPSIHSASMPSQHTLHKINLHKRGCKAQNSRQADTAMHCTTRRTRARGAAELAATTPWKTGQEL